MACILIPSRGLSALVCAFDAKAALMYHKHAYQCLQAVDVHMLEYYNYNERRSTASGLGHAALVVLGTVITLPHQHLPHKSFEKKSDAMNVKCQRILINQQHVARSSSWDCHYGASCLPIWLMAGSCLALCSG